MAITFQIRDGEYEKKEHIVMEIIEEVVERKVVAVTEANLVKTIAYLEQQKADFCAAKDAEIAINQERLDQIQALNKDVPLVESLAMPDEKNI